MGNRTDIIAKAAMAVCESDGCGYTVEGVRILCDDEAALAGLNDGYGKPLYRVRCDCRAAAVATINVMTGFLATLTPEQRAAALKGFDGDDTFGDVEKVK